MAASEPTIRSTTGPEAFPDSPRVIYRKNPLKEVICQLRFPPILRIEAEQPAEFQDKIRHEYPLFRQTHRDESFELPPDFPSGVAKVLRNALSVSQKRMSHEFLSADEVWKVVLTRDFLALTTQKYVRWEDFRAHLGGPLDTLCAVYAPAFFTRIGLRYQDLIQRSKLGLEGTPWSALLQPHVAGIFSSPDLRGSVAEVYSQVLIELPNNAAKVRLRHGLAQVAGSKEDCYLIDSDFFTDQRTETDGATAILNQFNRQSGRLFRWCIQDSLHQSMEPESVEAG